MTEVSHKSPTHHDKQIGINLRTLRRAQKMNQAQLGEALGGLTFQQIQKYEAGTNRISGSRIRKICSVLGCTYEDLLGEIPDLEQRDKPEVIMVPLDEFSSIVDSLNSKIDSLKRRTGMEQTG